jgi:hypothetical protein
MSPFGLSKTAALEREKQEIALEKLRLEIERERQTLIEHRLVLQP